MGRTALILTDVQNDFLPPNGALAVPDAREILPILEGLLDKSNWDWNVIIAAQDYHPKGHISFASTHDKEPFTDLTVTDAHGREYVQALWPDHCIIGSEAVEIDKGLRGKFGPWLESMKVVRKGFHVKLDAYSVFEGFVTDATNPEEPPSTDGSETELETRPRDSGLAKHLRSQGVEKVVVVGLATDFCVLQTGLSSLLAGFDTLLVDPAVKEIRKDGVAAAYSKLEGAGARIVGREKGEDWEASVRSWMGLPT